MGKLSTDQQTGARKHSQELGRRTRNSLATSLISNIHLNHNIHMVQAHHKPVKKNQQPSLAAHKRFSLAAASGSSTSVHGHHYLNDSSKSFLPAAPLPAQPLHHGNTFPTAWAHSALAAGMLFLVFPPSSKIPVPLLLIHYYLPTSLSMYSPPLQFTQVIYSLIYICENMMLVLTAEEQNKQIKKNFKKRTAEIKVGKSTERNQE